MNLDFCPSGLTVTLGINALSGAGSAEWVPERNVISRDPHPNNATHPHTHSTNIMVEIVTQTQKVPHLHPRNRHVQHEVIRLCEDAVFASGQK